MSPKPVLHPASFADQVGHWLGLLHVFAGGCDPSTGGDFVEDTRAAAAADYQCTSQNTCPDLTGTNPIHNYMGEPRQAPLDGC